MSSFVYYNLSPAAAKDAIEREFIATGKRPSPFNSPIRVVSFDATTLTPEQRAILLEFETHTRGNHIASIEARIDYSNKRPQKPAIVETILKLDHVPDIDEALAHMVRMNAEYRDALVQREALQPEYEAKLAEYEAAELAKRLQAAAREREAEEKREQERLARTVIPWREDGTAIFNLHDAIFAATDLDVDSRFKHWIRDIEKVDRSKDNGYMFEGAWVSDRTVEVKRGAIHVYLVAATTGSRKNQTTDYRVVVLNTSGVLELTPIETDDSDAGWSLRIRDDVERLLKAKSAEAGQPEIR